MERSMKRLMTLLAIAGLAMGASVAVAGASSAHLASAAAVVSTRSTSLGTVLVGPNGHTLYLDKSDPKDKSTCTGGCATIWPPLLTKGAPKAKGAAKASKLGTIKRGSAEQVVYDGHPLYYFQSDTAAGQTTGQGQNGFYVVSPSGSMITKSANSSSGGGGGGW
jgi:predicted lipoprotein with Yx(FWY)xxD motif